MSERTPRIEHGIVPDRAARGLRAGLQPIVRGLHSAGVAPNAVTVSGAVLSIVGAAFVGLEQPWPAALFLLIGSGADSLDGLLARISGQASTFGAFLDSMLDRVSDAAFFVGVAALAFRVSDASLLAVALWALVGSFLISYARAKAESLGRSAAVGLAPREGRIALVIAGVALWGAFGSRLPLLLATATVAILATTTVAQRISHVSRQ
jgi:CDP-diacylglycerol---glycerol-3-phosphate 3-phosphatidyltransferase